MSTDLLIAQRLIRSLSASLLAVVFYGIILIVIKRYLPELSFIQTEGKKINTHKKEKVGQHVDVSISPSGSHENIDWKQSRHDAQTPPQPDSTSRTPAYSARETKPEQRTESQSSALDRTSDSFPANNFVQKITREAAKDPQNTANVLRRLFSGTKIGG